MASERRTCPLCSRDVPVARRRAEYGGELVFRHHRIAAGHAAATCPMSRKPPPAQPTLRLVHSQPAWKVQRTANEAAGDG